MAETVVTSPNTSFHWENVLLLEEQIRALNIQGEIAALVNDEHSVLDQNLELVRQQMIESELDAKLRCEKSQSTLETAVKSKPQNYLNGYSKKAVKTQLGVVEVNIPREQNREYEPQIIGKDSQSADGMGRRKSWDCTPTG